jgi:phosphatidylserine/phosphatidylglycerophosphate/cardiolipin synthase-like enzyme
VIQVSTLRDGGQSALEVAGEIAAFLAAAERSLELALYDVRLNGESSEPVRRALEEATERGVRVRLAYNVDHAQPVAVPPPPKTDPQLVEALPVETKAIAGVPDLMHHKYVVRDSRMVLTGSTNWTEDSWTREENVIVELESPELAARYLENFRELWSGREVAASGHVRSAPLEIDGHRVRPWFTPGHGAELAHRIARRIAKARRRIRIASPVLSSGPILASLAEARVESVDIAGVLDATQVAEVIGQWRLNGHAAWKEELLRAVLARIPFTGKHSTPWGPTTVHDFMHAKLTVTDDVVFVGSFNLSRSGEKNAENVLEIEHAELAERLASFVDEIRSRYEPIELPPGL